MNISVVRGVTEEKCSKNRVKYVHLPHTRNLSLSGVHNMANPTTETHHQQHVDSAAAAAAAATTTTTPVTGTVVYDQMTTSVQNNWSLIKHNRLRNTHTHPFNGPLSRTTRVGRYQKGKTNLDFTEARDSEWQ